MKQGIFSVLFLIIFSGKLFARHDDFGLWTFVGVDKKISKVVNFYGEAEMRTRNDVKTVDCWALYAEISVKITPYLRGGGGYTYIDYNHPLLSWESRHRLNFFLNGSYSYQNWNFSIRERYEQLHRVISNNKPKRSLRSRFQCSYKVNRMLSPYATLELYTTLNGSVGGMFNDKTRYTIGTQIFANKQLAFSAYYRYIDMFDNNSRDSHILGIGCKFSL